MCRIELGKSGALFGQSINTRRFVEFTAVTAKIFVTHVIDEENDDVGFVSEAGWNAGQKISCDQ